MIHLTVTSLIITIFSDWLANLIRIREVYGSNLGLGTGYTDVLWFSSKPCKQIPGRFHYNPLQFTQQA
jgi:hypothetical protein